MDSRGCAYCASIRLFKYQFVFAKEPWAGLPVENPISQSGPYRKSATFAVNDEEAGRCTSGSRMRSSSSISIVRVSVGLNVPEVETSAYDVMPGATFATLKNRLRMPSACPLLSVTDEEMVCIPFERVVVSMKRSPLLRRCWLNGETRSPKSLRNCS
jgi:hypothetical protein